MSKLTILEMQLQVLIDVMNDTIMTFDDTGNHEKAKELGGAKDVVVEWLEAQNE